jgi:hypothetical protein
MGHINLSNGRNFTAAYEFVEYPKWIEHEGKTVLVHDAREERDLKSDVEVGMDNVREALMAEARALGLTPHHKTGVEKLQQLIDEAKP